MNIIPICTPPELDEMVSRLRKVQAGLVAQGLDALILHNPDNVFYMTNFANMVHERPFVMLVPASGTPVFVVPRIEEPHVRARSVGPVELVSYREFPAPAGEGWADRLQEVAAGFQHIGVEHDAPRYVVDAIGGTTVASSVVEDTRAVKSSYEISRHQYASNVMSLGLAEVFRLSKPGALPISVLGAARGVMSAKMFTDLPSANFLSCKFNAAPQPQPLSHDPHNFTDLFCPLGVGGPHVSLSAGKANGYGAEVERTFFINEVPEAARRPFDVMMEARSLAYSLAIPGAVMHEVDRSVNDFFRKNGYGDNLLHRTGHGFGVTDHEGPFLAEGDYREIRPGMVFSIEPGIYIPGIGGFRHSDTVLITETGNFSMTNMPESLESLTLQF